MSAKTEFDIAFLGHCTKDTIVLPHETKTVRGGAFHYGVHVVVEMGLKAAVITRLAEEDFDVVDDLSRMGVEVFAKATAQSTSLKLAYPTQDLDRRTVYNVGFAGPFTPAEGASVKARTFHIGASIRGEVPLEVIEALAQKEARISLDVQGFVRVNPSTTLRRAPGPLALVLDPLSLGQRTKGDKYRAQGQRAQDTAEEGGLPMKIGLGQPRFSSWWMS